MPNLSRVAEIGSGDFHSLAIMRYTVIKRKNGRKIRTTVSTAVAWGANYAGQLGDGTTTQRTAPVRVPNLSGVEAVAGGSSHSLALRTDGTVWTWGSNVYGQLGDGTKTDSAAPVRVPNLSSVADVDGGFAHSVAK